MVNRLRQQHVSASTPCKHLERQIVKCDPGGDPALRKYVVLLFSFSASPLNPSGHFFSYVTGTAMKAFTLVQSGFISALWISEAEKQASLQEDYRRVIGEYTDTIVICHN